MKSQGVLTWPQQRLLECGLCPLQVARRLTPGRKLSPRQLRNRAVTVSRVLRQGNCGALYARRLGALLEIDASLLELPCRCWPSSWRGDESKAQSQNAVETLGAPPGALLPASAAASTAAGEGAHRKSRPRTLSPDAPPLRRPQSGRMEILRLVP